MRIFSNYGLMDYEINYYFRNNPSFRGCYPINKIPVFTKLPACVILNTDPAGEKGEHWLALIVKKNCFIYFDSFGVGVMEPQLLQYLKKYKGTQRIFFSEICIQHYSSHSCGLYCTAFIECVKSPSSYNKFLNIFDHVNLYNNEWIVRSLINKGV